MTHDFQSLRKELSTLYPDITDSELDQVTKNLIDFSVLGIKLLSKSNNATPFTEIDDH